MNKSVLMIMGGALLVAIIVAMVVQAKLAPSTPAESASVEILVAQHPMNIGSSLKAEDVKWQAWPEDGLFKGMIKKSDYPDGKEPDFYDVPLRRSVEAGEPITHQVLIADIKGSNNFLAASITPGMRAVAITVQADTTVGGFVSPGDMVDVILSYQPQLPSDVDNYGRQVIQTYASQTILSNIRVLAVDQTSAENEKKEATVGKTVTLEVTREGAQVLALSRKMGEITLALRRIGEEDKVPPSAFPLTTDVTTSDVLRRLDTIKQKTSEKSNIVRVYSGGSVINMPVRAADENPNFRAADDAPSKGGD